MGYLGLSRTSLTVNSSSAFTVNLWVVLHLYPSDSLLLEKPWEDVST